MNRNIIFGTKVAPAAPKIIAQNHQAQSEPKQRKKRIDALQDIKFRLPVDDKKALQLLAMDHQLSLTAFASMIVKRELDRPREHYQTIDYDNNGPFVHVTLEHDYFVIVQHLHVDWSMPYRRVVHRIISDYIWRMDGGIIINDWSGDNERI